jgi:hypothetical protein
MIEPAPTPEKDKEYRQVKTKSRAKSKTKRNDKDDLEDVTRTEDKAVEVEYLRAIESERAKDIEIKNGFTFPTTGLYFSHILNMQPTHTKGMLDSGCGTIVCKDTELSDPNRRLAEWNTVNGKIKINLLDPSLLKRKPEKHPASLRPTEEARAYVPKLTYGSKT